LVNSSYKGAGMFGTVLFVIPSYHPQRKIVLGAYKLPVMKNKSDLNGGFMSKWWFLIYNLSL